MNIKENLGVWNGCEFREILLIFVLSFILSLSASLTILPKNFAFVLAIIGSIVGLFLGSKKLQAIKRNKPKNFYQKKIAILTRELPTYQKYNTYSRL
jgi:conjugative transfer region protein (TIGR03750 family)